jgi:hypothetical protein
MHSLNRTTLKKSVPFFADRIRDRGRCGEIAAAWNSAAAASCLLGGE